MKTKIILIAILSPVLLTSLIHAQNTINITQKSIGKNECAIISNNFKFRANNKSFKSNDKNSNGKVTKLQNFLLSKGYIKVSPTGNYGPATVEGVKEFQRKNNLIVTGIVGNITRDKINSVSCQRADDTPETTTKIETNQEQKRLAADKQSTTTLPLVISSNKDAGNIKKLSEMIQSIEQDMKSEDCEKNKSECDKTKMVLKTLKDACLKVKESEVDSCIAGAVFGAAMKLSNSGMLEEVKEAAKSKEAYLNYLKKSGIDFKDGVCDSFSSRISSSFNGYKYTEVCKDKKKTYIFEKEVNGSLVPVSRDEYLEQMYNTFLKQLPNLIKSLE
jgi:hypothetical protein